MTYGIQVVVLCIINMCYYIPDVFFTLDTLAPPIEYVLEHPKDQNSAATIYYSIPREVRHVASTPRA